MPQGTSKKVEKVLDCGLKLNLRRKSPWWPVETAVVLYVVVLGLVQSSQGAIVASGLQEAVINSKGDGPLFVVPYRIDDQQKHQLIIGKGKVKNPPSLLQHDHQDNVLNYHSNENDVRDDNLHKHSLLLTVRDGDFVDGTATRIAAGFRGSLLVRLVEKSMNGGGCPGGSIEAADSYYFDGRARIMNRINDTHLRLSVRLFYNDQNRILLLLKQQNGQNVSSIADGVCASLNGSDLFYLPIASAEAPIVTHLTRDQSRSESLSFTIPQQQKQAKRRSERSISAGSESQNTASNRDSDDERDEAKSKAEKEAARSLVINGIRVEHADKEPLVDDDGVPTVLSYSSVTLRLFGLGLTEDTVVVFTHESNTFGGSCLVPATNKYRIAKGSISSYSALVHLEFPATSAAKYFYICAKYESNDTFEQSARFASPFIHQGMDSWMRIASYEPVLPLWVSLIIITVCLMFSALFSGLNLGLMSLDRTDLKILCNTGTESEKLYARAIQP
ncbi:uncharacterized protein LOC129760646, partial [Uranotaenia lowii]|uniref:uncharacterized protein LOC129760646 n=1 Tax=Uranotaenia lowii TaxID=190385 RepID=UPI002478A160